MGNVVQGTVAYIHTPCFIITAEDEVCAAPGADMYRQAL